MVIPLEVKKPKFRFFVYEIIYSLKKLFNYRSMFKYPFKNTHIITKYGKFIIRPKTTDAITISPAYERLDLNFMVKLINRDTSKNTLFLDVGANIGGYTISIGNIFKNRKNLNIFSFEPIEENYKLLVDNIKLNQLEHIVTPVKEALSDTCGFGNISFGEYSQTCELVTLDTFFNSIDLSGYDLIIIKIDVEGMEKKVMEGSKKFLRQNKGKIFLMVEDFIDNRIIDYLLKEKNATFLRKFTPYNSWWLL